MAQTNTEKIGTGTKIIAAIILLLIMVGIPIAIVLWSQAETQKMLDEGCVPSGASDWLGNPTVWTCPIK